MNMPPMLNRKILRSYFERLEVMGIPEFDTADHLEYQYIKSLLETYKSTLGEADARAFQKPLKPSESFPLHIQEVLAIFRKYNLDNPFIIGSISEDEDVELGFMFDEPKDFEFQTMFYAANELEVLLSVKINMLSSEALNNEHWTEFQKDELKHSLQSILPV